MNEFKYQIKMSELNNFITLNKSKKFSIIFKNIINQHFMYNYFILELQELTYKNIINYKIMGSKDHIYLSRYNQAVDIVEILNIKSIIKTNFKYDLLTIYYILLNRSSNEYGIKLASQFIIQNFERKVNKIQTNNTTKIIRLMSWLLIHCIVYEIEIPAWIQTEIRCSIYTTTDMLPDILNCIDYLKIKLKEFLINILKM
jgi:hypothetical protein